MESSLKTLDATANWSGAADIFRARNREEFLVPVTRFKRPDPGAMHPLSSISTASSPAQAAHRSEQWRIVIGSDLAGLTYKATLKAVLEADERVAGVIDVGFHAGQLTSHEHVARAAAQLVTNGRADRALLISGSGLGVAISANKVRGIRAVIASDSSSVQRSVLENDAQVLCLGYRVVNLELARRLAGEWLDYRFDWMSAHNVAML